MTPKIGELSRKLALGFTEPEAASKSNFERSGWLNAYNSRSDYARW